MCTGLLAQHPSNGNLRCSLFFSHQYESARNRYGAAAALKSTKRGRFFRVLSSKPRPSSSLLPLLGPASTSCSQNVLRVTQMRTPNAPHVKTLTCKTPSRKHCRRAPEAGSFWSSQSDRLDTPSFIFSVTCLQDSAPTLLLFASFYVRGTTY